MPSAERQVPNVDGGLRPRQPDRVGRFAAAVLVPGLLVAAVLIALDQGRLQREARAARDLDLTPVSFAADVEGLVVLPSDEGDAAEAYQRAFLLLDDEHPRYEALKKDLERRGVTADTDVEFRALAAFAEAAGRRRCRFEPHLPETPAEVDAERERLLAFRRLGTLAAARSGVARLRGRGAEAGEWAARLVIAGWHLLQPPGGTPAAPPAPGGSRPASLPARFALSTATSVDARIEGLTLIRWGAHALAPWLRETQGDTAADRAKAIEAAAGAASDALAAARRPLGRSLFTQARVAMESRDTGLRVLAVAFLGEEVAGPGGLRYPGRARRDAIADLLDRLAIDPDAEVAAAARAARARMR